MAQGGVRRPCCRETRASLGHAKQCRTSSPPPSLYNPKGKRGCTATCARGAPRVGHQSKKRKGKDKWIATARPPHACNNEVDLNGVHIRLQKASKATTQPMSKRGTRLNAHLHLRKPQSTLTALLCNLSPCPLGCFVQGATSGSFGMGCWVDVSLIYAGSSARSSLRAWAPDNISNSTGEQSAESYRPRLRQPPPPPLPKTTTFCCG